MSDYIRAKAAPLHKVENLSNVSMRSAVGRLKKEDYIFSSEKGYKTFSGKVK